jgi:hypothetical protein
MIRRRPSRATALVVGLVAAVALAGALDALRTRDDSGSAPETTSTALAETASLPDPAAARALRDAGVTGLLVVSDRACRLSAFGLPGLEPAELSGRACRLVESGGLLSLDGRLADPDRENVAAACAAGVVELVEDGQRVAAAGSDEGGCAIAWRDAGRLTSVVDGDLVELRREPGSNVLRPRTIVSARENERAFASGLGPRARRTLAFVEAVWPQPTRLVAILRFGPRPRYLLAFFAGRQLDVWRCCFDTLGDLRRSRSGGFVTVRSDRGVLVFRDGGDFVPIGLEEEARAVAWSPRDEWIAVARQSGVQIFEPFEGGYVPIAFLPLAAPRDIAWTPNLLAVSRP